MLSKYTFINIFQQKENVVNTYIKVDNHIKIHSYPQVNNILWITLC